MKWIDLTSSRFRNLDRDIPVVLNIGAVEQHGHHLPVETDSLIGKFFLDQVDKILEDDILILPQVSICCSAHHMDFAGTLSVSHLTLMRYVTEILESVLHHGFWKLVLFNSHGGNLAIGQVILEHMGATHSECRPYLFTWWKLVAEELADLQESDFGGVGHACEFETSLIQHIDQNRVGTIPQSIDKPATHAWAEADMLVPSRGAVYRSMKEITAGSGVAGSPQFASAEKGAEITRLVVAALVDVLRDIRRDIRMNKR